MVNNRTSASHCCADTQSPRPRRKMRPRAKGLERSSICVRTPRRTVPNPSRRKVLLIVCRPDGVGHLTMNRVMNDEDIRLRLARISQTHRKAPASGSC